MSETITTAEELDALPVGAVVRAEESGGATVAEKNEHGLWDIAGVPLTGSLACRGVHMLANAPFTVLYRPDRPTTALPTEEALRAAVLEEMWSLHLNGNGGLNPVCDCIEDPCPVAALIEAIWTGAEAEA